MGSVAAQEVWVGRTAWAGWEVPEQASPSGVGEHSSWLDQFVLTLGRIYLDLCFNVASLYDTRVVRLADLSLATQFIPRPA